MKIKLLPSSFDERGRATQEQRLSCFLVDGRVTIDAGSIALAIGPRERASVRDMVVTHPHLDHIATLPIFIDDLFATLDEPVRVHATREVIELLKRDVFNGTVYPPFQDFKNGRTNVLEFVPFEPGAEFRVAHLRVTAATVTHIVPTVGLVLTDGERTIAFSSDTSATEEFWRLVNRQPRLDALIVETSFPNRLAQLAEISGHLTSASLGRELQKLEHRNVPVLVMHLKPMYREQIIGELDALGRPGLSAMEVGREYEW